MLRELCAAAHAEAGAGRAQTALGHHGSAQAGRGELWQEHDAGAEGHLFGLLPQRGQEGSAGGLQDSSGCAGGQTVLFSVSFVKENLRLNDLGFYVRLSP